MMKQLITEFPNNITEAIKIAANSNFSQPKNEIRNVVICGMGGSGIGGSIVSKWLEDELSIPIYVSKDYSLPNFVNENSLVIGSSYSGDTEETLSSVELAIKKGAHIIGITISSCIGCLLETLTLSAPTNAGNKAINALSKKVAKPAMALGILPKSCKLT